MAKFHSTTSPLNLLLSVAGFVLVICCLVFMVLVFNAAKDRLDVVTCTTSSTPSVDCPAPASIER